MEEQKELHYKQEREEQKDAYEALEKQYEASEIKRGELEKKMNQLRRGINTTAQGGWGTFTVVFEENREYHGIELNGKDVPTGSAISKKSGGQ